MLGISEAIIFEILFEGNNAGRNRANPCSRIRRRCKCRSHAYNKCSEFPFSQAVSNAEGFYSRRQKVLDAFTRCSKCRVCLDSVSNARWDKGLHGPIVKVAVSV